MDEKACALLRVIGDSSRFRILRYLSNKPRNVSEIVRELGLKQSLVSHHLKILRTHGLLECVRDGPFVRYSLSKPEMIERIILSTYELVDRKTPK